MAERTIATVLKTVEVQASGGSNPPPSATQLPYGDLKMARSKWSPDQLLASFRVAAAELQATGSETGFEMCLPASPPIS